MRAQNFCGKQKQKFQRALEGRAQQMPRIGEDENKQQIAIDRRNAQDLPNMNVINNTRICFNCNQSILNEIAAIQADNMCLRLNVLRQRGNRVCIICNAENNVIRISLECRVHVFIQSNIYIPKNVRSCAHHLNRNGLFITGLIARLRYINKPYVIRGS